MMREFNDDASTNYMVFLCTFSHGMVEVHLHEACGMVIAFDSPNTMSQEIQAIGRVRRLGQKKKTVQFIEITTDGTIQDVVLARKRSDDYDILRVGLMQEEEPKKQDKNGGRNDVECNTPRRA